MDKRTQFTKGQRCRCRRDVGKVVTVVAAHEEGPMGVQAYLCADDQGAVMHISAADLESIDELPQGSA